MSVTTEAPTEITEGQPPTLDGPSIRPGYLTTEFWQTNLVHLFAAISSMLVFLNVNIAHLTVIQGLIPMVAIGASLIAQTAYNNKRAAVKMHQITKWGEVNVAHVEKLAPLVPIASELILSADPAFGAKIQGAAHAFNEGWTEFPVSDAGTVVDTAKPAAPEGEPTDDPTDVQPAEDVPADVSTEDPAT